MAEEQNKKPSKPSKKKTSKGQTLTQKQKKFCREYVKLGNITQATINAGYSKRTAGVMGCRLLKNVSIQEEIMRISGRQQEVERKEIADAQEVMEYFSKVMRGEIKDQFGLDAPLAERTKAAQELAKRTVDLTSKVTGKASGQVKISLVWEDEEPEEPVNEDE